MNEKTIDQYFKSVRSLPLAMSLEEVQALVKINAVSTLGHPRASWWTLKTIIFMITIAVILASFLFLTSSKNEEKEPIKQEKTISVKHSEHLSIVEPTRGTMAEKRDNISTNFEIHQQLQNVSKIAQLADIQYLDMLSPFISPIDDVLEFPDLIGSNGGKLYDNNKKDEKTPPTKTFEKEIAVNDAEWLVVHNKGDIRIETWNEEKVQLKALVTIEGDEEDVQKALKELDFNLVQDGNKIELTKTGWDKMGDNCSCSNTKIKVKGSDKKTETFRIKNYHVDYVLQIPKRLNVDLESNFGDINLASIDGDAALKSTQGKVIAGNIGGVLNLDSRFGSTITVGNFKSGDISLTQCKSNFGACGDLKLHAQFSTVSFTKVGNLDVDAGQSDLTFTSSLDQLKGIIRFGKLIIEGHSTNITLNATQLKMEANKIDQFDLTGSFNSFKIKGVTNLSTSGGNQNKYTIGELSNLKGVANFSNFDVETLNGSMKLETTQGNIKIGKVLGDFSVVDIKSKFTKIDLNFASDAKFNFDAKSDFSVLNYSDAIQVNFKEKENSKLNVKGIYNVANTKNPSEVNIVCFQGTLDLK